MADTDDAARVAHRWIELFNEPAEGWSLRHIDELYAPDVEWLEMPTPYHPQGRGDRLADLLLADEAAGKGLGERHAELHDVVADGNRAAMRYTFTATLLADAGSIPAGTRIAMEVAAFLEVRNGRIVEIREYLSTMRPA